jgi:hypothetical protein
MAQYSENRAFRHKTATAAGCSGFCFSRFMRQIRYLADQWNFAPINELKPPYQPKNSRIRAGRENREIQ